MIADTIPENPEPTQTTVQKDAGTSSAVPPKESITVETIDVSNRPQVIEDDHLSILPPDATKVSSQAS